MGLNPRILRIAVVAIALLTAGGCGGEGANGASTTTSIESTSTAAAPKLRRDQDVAAICRRLSRRVSAEVRGLTGRPSPALSEQRLRATNFSSCRLGAHDVALRMTLDTAAEVRTRYDNRITESQQFSSRTPGLFPRPVQGVGDRHASGGGANWLAVFNQLLSIRGSHELAITFYVKGASDRQLESAATRVALATWGLLGVPRR